MATKTNSKKEQKLFKGFTIVELILLVISIIIAVGGLTLMVTSLVGDNLDTTSNIIKDSDMALQKFWNAPIGFRWLGLIFLVAGTIFSMIFLNIASAREEKIKEKELRREERIKSLKEAAALTQGVVVANAEEVDSTISVK